MNARQRDHPKVGKLRPTQVISQHGPGAIVDLPKLSVVIAGLDRWSPHETRDCIGEPRLEAFLRVESLFRPPPASAPADGVPSFVFPEWLVCPDRRCRLLASKENFEWVGPPAGVFRCRRSESHGGRSIVDAFPARFMIACPAGHLDDFPWHDWLHRGSGGNCQGPLKLHDIGRSGSVNDLWVRCEECKRRRNMSGVFEPGTIEGCAGRRPWLGLSDYEAGCLELPRVILRGASNGYFAVVASALSIPPHSAPIQMAIEPFRERLRLLDTEDKINQASDLGLLGELLNQHAADKVLSAASNRATGVERLRPDEYKVFLDPPEPAQPPHEFEVRHVGVPAVAEASRVATVAQATRLREVRALRGFTRIESGFDVGELADVAELHIDMAPIGPRHVTWRPAVALRGEGIFLALEERAVAAWETAPKTVEQAARLSVSFGEFQAQRSGTAHPFPRMRYVLLHSLAHALIRRLCLDAGYSSSALRERIYSAVGNEPMAGMLIYTASSDSEGSLGGLVDQAVPERFGAVLVDALRDAQLCAQDPLCGAGELSGHAGLNGAACHACLLLAETSCEAGNRFLDRAVLVETLGQFGRWFLRGP